MARPLVRLGHVHLKVRDLARSVDFYTRVLGLRVSEEVGGTFAFLTSGDAHHELALQEVGAGAPNPPQGATGLFHVAFEAPDDASFARAFTALRDAGLEVSAVDYGISWALYTADPDGHGVEVYLDTRQAAGGRARWGGRSAPLDAASVLRAASAAGA
jgi:catechol 2,3-dioxygenase